MVRAFFSRLEFWQQLVIFFSAGMIVLGISTSVVLTLTASDSLKSQLTGQSLYLTESLARQARLSLLYQSPDEAASVVAIAHQYPDVVGVGIHTEDGRLLSGDASADSPVTGDRLPDTAALVEEHQDHLLFVAPVRTQLEEDDPLHDDDSEIGSQSEVLGYLSLVVSKRSLDDIGSRLFYINLLVSILVAFPLLLVLVILSRRLTNPLRLLSAVMNRAETGELNLRAEFHGPRDIADMQKAFNTMMASLETQTRELEVARDQAIESATIKAEFAANVSHELRTPMNAVIGMLDLLSVMGLSVQQREYVETARDSAQNLLALIDDILSYVRVDTGRLVLESTAFDLRELIEEVIALMATQAMKKGIDIGYLLDTTNVQLMADRQRLRHALINLVGNAVKFTEQGEVQVTVSLSEQGGEHLEIEVRDTGIGIARESQDRIFDAFTQEDATTTRKFGGTGLGLAICRQYVALLGGEIGLESEKGEGSRFHCSLPVEVLYRKPDALDVPSRFDGRTVAVLDDSLAVRAFLARWLSARGADVRAFANLADLFSFLNSLEPTDQSVACLMVDEGLLGGQLDNMLGMIIQHPGCAVNMETVVMVNPWTLSQITGQTGYQLLEKPLTEARMADFLARPREAPPPRRSIPAQGALEADSRRQLRVLVVEDNQANCLVAKGMLEQLGCTLEVAHNGREAIQAMTRSPFDIVLMDCNMPVMDGYQATAEIRALEGDAPPLPIIAMTANNQQVEKDRCLQAGMSDFIAKPLTVEALRSVLDKWRRSTPADGVAQSAPGYAAGGQGLINRQEIERLKASVGDVFPAVVGAFLEDMPIYLDSLGEAVKSADSRQVFEFAHSIKGGAAIFGGTQVSSLAEQLEAKGRSGNLMGSPELLESLVDRVHGMMDELASYTGHRAPDNLVPQGENALVLVADDDRVIRLAFCQALQEAGFRTVEVENGQSAIALCARSNPQLIVLDAIMPEVDGFAACRRIRGMAHLAEVPVLMVTSLTDDESVLKAFRCGATDYVSKPVNMSVFRERVTRLLRLGRTERHVRTLAYQDSLTGLPNRSFFNQQLRHRISRANLNQTALAVIFLDVDRFKVVNDSLGHDAGDLILKAVAQRLRESVDEEDLVARLGGDEFAIIIEPADDRGAIENRCRHLLDALAEPITIMAQNLYMAASMGVSLYPGDGATAREMVKHADNALYKAKASRDRYCFYQRGMESESLERLEVERDVRRALAENQFHLVYQPQMDTRSQRVSRAEALVRWRHPTRGTLSAADFVPAVERLGLIAELGRIVYRMAFRDLETCHNQGLALRVAINVSGGELQEGRLRGQLSELFGEFHFPAQMLEIEITESMLMDNPKLVENELAAIRQQGISIAIDDFGSGFSSLSYLKNFAVDLVKIDREFTRDCHVSKNDQAIISGIIALAKTLSLEVVAEGVELREHFEFLKSAGCDYVQGYLVGREVSLEQLMAFLDEPPVFGDGE